MVVKYSLRSAERHLKGLAYLSVFLDGFVALATVLSLSRPIRFYTTFLYLSDYLIFVEVVAAIFLSASILYLKYAKKISRKLALSYFRYRVSIRKRQVRQVGEA
jgi:hypothetical protein